MMKAYINYPEPHITAHYDPNCGKVQAHHKFNQRYRRINITTISLELKNFRNKKHAFSTNTAYNDMWLEIDFNDRDYELAVLNDICRLLGTHYRPFAGKTPTIHC